MERLTERIEENYIPRMDRKIGHKSCMNKLGKLEDLEEQIGMSLSQLFNEILGKTIYYIDDDYIASCRAMGIRLITTNDTIFSFLDKIQNNYDYMIVTDSCWTFGVDDYKKLWFIDEDEAENYFKKVYEKGDV